MQDPQTRVMVRAVLMTTTGKLEREWTWADIQEAAKTAGSALPQLLKGAPPAWLKNPKKKWPKPGDPITYTGTVKPGHEDEAREALGL